DGLRMAGRPVRRPDRTLATADHNVPTGGGRADDLSEQQLAALARNTEEFGVPFYPLGHRRQGIVHVIGPELGVTQPGMTIVCGDSHTSTHGALGALAFGIGTSEVEHVLATQCLPQRKPKTMLIQVNGKLSEGVSAKDLALGIIGRIGTDGATGHVIEYAGEAVRSLSLEGRMTLCNMSIEAGARAGMIAPDEKTFTYMAGRRYAPQGKDWEEAVAYWRSLPSDQGAKYDTVIEINARDLAPCVTWGTNPGMVVPITACVPELPANGSARANALRMLDYMDLRPGTPMEQIRVDRVFIGSCTNSRI